MKSLYLTAALAAFFLLIIYSDAAEAAALRGILLCAKVIVPSLLPFFIVSSLINKLGLAALVGRFCAPVMSRLFGVSGAGAASFIIGISGGYPLGAASVAELVKDGEVSREEGSRLLAFCNNSGPAFIIGAAGVGIFKSSSIGLTLYAAHVLAAITVGVLLAGKRREAGRYKPRSYEMPGFAPALTEAVKSSVAALLNVCGFVVFFTVCVGILDALGAFSYLAGQLAVNSGCGLHFSRALLTGLLEIGGGIGAMCGMEATPNNLALCAFILGWGGLSVHFQTMAAVSAENIKTARHAVGRLLIGLFSALYVWCFAHFI